jgi:tetratricopeptide (TPR) repeat protein
VAWGRVLEVNPKNIAANLKMGGLIAKQTSDKALDRDDQLAQAEKYANTALDGLKTQEAVPGLPAQSVAQLKINEGEAHMNLAFVWRTRAMANKAADPAKYDKAITEMQTAVADDPAQTAYQAQLATILHQAGKNAEAIALCDKILALPELNPQIKTFTESLKREAGGQVPAAAAPAAK